MVQRSILTRNPHIFNTSFLHQIFANMKFWQTTMQCIFCKWRKHSTSSPRIEPTTFVSGDNLSYLYGTSVLCGCTPLGEVSLFIERTDYRSNLAKTILFENCSCFSKIPFSISVESPRIFQGFISIPAGHWVRQMDGKSSAICLADSFCQHYSALWSAWQEDPNDPQERCAMARTSCAKL